MRLLVIAFLVTACEREERTFKGSAPGARPVSLQPQTSVFAGEPPIAGGELDPDMPGYKETAYAINQGQSLYAMFNCVGCHAHGGGAIGPAFLDKTWIYGSKPYDIAVSIIAGRANGMPSYRGKLVSNQLYALVAYVRAVGGLVRGDAIPARDDHMSVSPILDLNEQGWPPWPKEHR